MKLSLLAIAILSVSTTAAAQVHVRGYTTKNGTYVAPHYRSAPDGNPYNNWSTRGNVNPYTGQTGTRSPYGTSGQGSNAYGSYGSSYGTPTYSTPNYGCLYCAPPAPVPQPYSSDSDAGGASPY